MNAHTRITHDNDNAGEARVIEVARRLPSAVGEVEVIAHVAHPHDDTHSITTVTVSNVGHMSVHVFVTWRDEDGGNVEEVASPVMNAAA